MRQEHQHSFFEAVPLDLELPAQKAAGLHERFTALHSHLRRSFMQIDRMSVALYDPKMDLLKTFVHSNVAGEPLRAHQCRLTDSPSLLALKQERKSRVIDDIPQTLRAKTDHTRQIKEMGYLSSYTRPLFHQDVFEGFLFFDSCQPAAFTAEMRSRLEVYVNLIMLMVCHEVSTVRTLLGSVQVARDFTGLRDDETGAHLDRMARYCRLIARGIAKTHDLADEFIEQIFLFAPLHDIGKVGIPDSILRKPGSFTPDERQMMQSHVHLGIRMVQRLVEEFNLGAVAGISILRNLVAFHHEFLDGTGYPAGAAGGAIPIEARIVTVADIFDALTSRRVYKEAWSIAAAWEELDRLVAAGKLDGACVTALRAGEGEALQIMERFV